MSSDKNEKRTIWVYRIDQWSKDKFRLLYVHADDKAPRQLFTYTLEACDELDAWKRFKQGAPSHHVEFRSSAHG